MMEGMNAASIFEMAQYWRPRFLSDAPKWYSSVSSIIRKRSWNTPVVFTVSVGFCLLNFAIAVAVIGVGQIYEAAAAFYASSCILRASRTSDCE